jgi:hypothetical protein
MTAEGSTRAGLITKESIRTVLDRPVQDVERRPAPPPLPSPLTRSGEDHC